MSDECLYFCAKLGIPQANGTILATCENVFRAAFSISSDVNWALVF